MKQRGVTLVELIVALGALLAIVTPLLMLMMHMFVAGGSIANHLEADEREHTITLAIQAMSRDIRSSYRVHEIGTHHLILHAQTIPQAGEDPIPVTITYRWTADPRDGGTGQYLLNREITRRGGTLDGRPLFIPEHPYTLAPGSPTTATNYVQWHINFVPGWIDETSVIQGRTVVQYAGENPPPASLDITINSGPYSVSTYVSIGFYR